MTAKPYTHDDLLATLRAELARTGQSQTWLADQLGESKHWVSRRFAGLTDISVTELIRIADALAVPVSTFLPAEASA